MNESNIDETMESRAERENVGFQVQHLINIIVLSHIWLKGTKIQYLDLINIKEFVD
jgi:hypothetical protein